MKPTRYYSKIQEDAVAKALGGVRTSNSGATPFTKGDVIVGECIIECKTKIKETQSMAIQRSWLKDIERERQQMGKTICALAIAFKTGGPNYYIINERTMKRFLEYVEEEKNLYV